MSRYNSHKQKGIVLLGFVIFIIMGAFTYFLSSLSVAEIKQQQLEVTTKALQQAKQALISYALVYGDTDGDNPPDGIDFPGEYGFLPCPDYNNGLAEGIEDESGCGARGEPKLGFFPWFSLDVPVLRDESGTCLLYAVTGEYKNETSVASNKTLMLNEDSNGMFQIVNQAGTILQGTNPEDRIVAIIIAPGKALDRQMFGAQSRNFTAGTFCGRDYINNYNAYLDAGGGVDNSDVSVGAVTIDQFIHATAQSIADNNPNPYNDRFITITRDEIWEAITTRTDFSLKMIDLTEALTMCLANYAAGNGDNQLPWPVAMTLADYRDNINYDDNVDETQGYTGRFPLIVDSSNGRIGNAGAAELFSNAACNNLIVPTTGTTVDLQTPGAEYRRLWENWKDHFFYAVSKDFAPDTAESPASCGTCIEVEGDSRAAAVIFSGTRQGNQVRNEPRVGPTFDVDTKFVASNYMENDNEDNFPDANGDGEYSTGGTNDYIFCLTETDPPVAISC